MGTIQLLLIVVGVVVVGISVAVGTSIFGSNHEEANKDAITQDILRMVSAAEGYYRKPRMLGGGGRTFERITLEDCGAESSGSVKQVENINGTYHIAEASEDVFSITGASITDPAHTVTISIDMSVAKEKRLTISYENW
ncbi:MAG TPA: hypothetical protein PK916_01530 [Bacteroidota bacterium]|nr:hypothetical protein [Bacteroidota bacterium]